ncbi:MAG TPA: adenylate/guanylate cyclase domain-containing protein [Solirubrobacterales bacterium]|nr:adenylate/guanylate cyclase domain-containing protein [Solirubrobacterales bacterium]
MSRPDRIESDGERKQVTVLFADVKGSMDLAERQDPEQWREIMQRFFAILAEDVHRFEGTVDKFTGDGIMAVFGAPVAHEDHARRACYAALKMLDDIAAYAAELRRRDGLNFSARIGVNSGEVVAGAIGAGGDGGYTAIGHTVGLAQRMEALAEPGKAYLTESAAELAHGFLALEDLGEFEIKGASRPVRVFELAGIGAAHSRLDLSRERGFSEFVGRAAEMQVLSGALDRAKAGEGAAVGIVAEAGVGKSRLCHEFAERCRAERIEVFEAQAQAHGRGIPFMPVLQMLRAYFGIADADPERIAREKIAGRALLLDPGLADDLPLLFDFLGVPDPDRPLPQLSAEARQRALRGVVCKLVNAPARREPVVIVVEDLHWIDESSEALLGELLGAVEGTRTLVVVNFRPEHEPSWSGPPDYHRIDLEPLGPDDTAELVRDLAGEDPSLDGLAEHLHERTAGNPFFIEEIVRELAEAGHLEGERGAFHLIRPVEEIGVPATVQAVLAARVDRLGADAKQLVQAASVAGKEVSEATLIRVSGLAGEGRCEAALGEAIGAGFLYEAELYPERLLAFRHPLTREVAYGSQLAEQRRATHAAVARATIELNPDRHDELAALIADHMEEGEEKVEAARWSARAAYWAGHSQPREAMRLWRRTMDLADTMEEDEERAVLAVSARLRQLDYAWRLGMDADEEARLAREAEEIATRTNDLRSLTLLRALTAGRPGRERDGAEWIATTDEVNRLADESGDHHLRVAIRAATTYAHLCAADYAGVERLSEEVLELAGDDPDAGAGIVIGCPVAWAEMCLGLCRRERGELEQAAERFERALELATERGDPETASWTRGNLATLAASRGDADTGLALARRNRELTEQLGDVFSRCLALVSLATVELAAGESAAALDALEEAEQLYRGAMGGGGEVGSWRAALRAQALCDLGRAGEALELAEWAADTARGNGMLWPLPRALQALAEVRAALGRDGVGEALDEAAAVAERTGALLSLREIESTRGRIAAATR